jgi:hypothetical protein
MKKYINFTYKNNIETFQPDPQEFETFVNNLTSQIKNKNDEEQKLEFPRLLNKLKDDIRNNEYDNNNYRQKDLYGRYRKSILENSTLTNIEAIDLINNTIKTTLEEKKLEEKKLEDQKSNDKKIPENQENRPPVLKSAPATQIRPVQKSTQQITRVQEPPPLLEIPMLTLQELENQNKTKMFKEVLNKKDEEMAQKLQETENQLVIYGQPIGKEPRSEKQKTLTNFENQILQNQPPIPAITEILKPADEFNDPPVEDIKKLSKKEQAKTGFNEKVNIFNFTIGPYINFCQTTPGMRKPTEDVQKKITELVYENNNMPGKKITYVDLITYKQDKNIKSVNEHIKKLLEIKQVTKFEKEREEKKAKK